MARSDWTFLAAVQPQTEFGSCVSNQHLHLGSSICRFHKSWCRRQTQANTPLDSGISLACTKLVDAIRKQSVSADKVSAQFLRYIFTNLRDNDSFFKCLTRKTESVIPKVPLAKIPQIKELQRGDISSKDSPRR